MSGLTWYLEVEEGAPPAAHLLHAVEVVGQVRRRQHAQHRDDVVVDDGEDVLQVLALLELRARLLVDVLQADDDTHTHTVRMHASRQPVRAPAYLLFS